jgi:N-acetylglucosamine-6-phosphate deacetylase
MATSIRQQIMTAVDARLKTVTTDNGYNTNLGASVHEWRETALEIAELPGVIYRDISQTTVIAVGYHVHNLVLELDIFVSGASAPALLRQCIADAITAVGTDRQWSTLAEDTLPVNDENIAIEHEGKRIGGVRLRFVIQYCTQPFDPYKTP